MEYTSLVLVTPPAVGGTSGSLFRLTFAVLPGVTSWSLDVFGDPDYSLYWEPLGECARRPRRTTAPSSREPNRVARWSRAGSAGPRRSPVSRGSRSAPRLPARWTCRSPPVGLLSIGSGVVAAMLSVAAGSFCPQERHVAHALVGTTSLRLRPGVAGGRAGGRADRLRRFRALTSIATAGHRRRHHTGVAVAQWPSCRTRRDSWLPPTPTTTASINNTDLTFIQRNIGKTVCATTTPQPTIAAPVSPAANTTGWHRGDVVPWSASSAPTRRRARRR